jgi:hypothetical protein
MNTNRARYAAALAAGILFGLGLMISGMVYPSKVLGFLDVAGNWDPSLLLVLGGAVATTHVGYRWVLRRSRPLFESRFRIPETSAIDHRLVIGASLFGIGWGLVGYCPGPAIAALVLNTGISTPFLIAMVFGAWCAQRVTKS